MKAPKTLLEKNIAILHEDYFFKELTFSVMDLPSDDGKNSEFADNLIYLDGIACLYQMKERTVEKSTPEAEEKWFQRKVLDKAVKQIKDSARFLYERPELKFKNLRNHEIKFSKYGISKLHQIIIYNPNNLLPPQYLKSKYHISDTAGLIHIFSAQEYTKVLNTLPLIVEFSEYLSFRAKLIEIWHDTINFKAVCESAILGQFFSTTIFEKPSNDYYDAYHNHIMQQEIDIQEWDISRILGKMYERSDGNLHYYLIFNEIAKLKRFELKEFKKRCAWSMEEARKNIARHPHFLVNWQTKCGFIFLPLVQAKKASVCDQLKLYTNCLKYYYKLPKCVGIAFVADGDDEYDSPIIYGEGAWEYDNETEMILKELELDKHFQCAIK